MALANEILVGRFQDLLTRLFRITGGRPAPQLTPEITPVAVTAGDDAENRYLKREQLLQAGQATSNAVGKNAYVQVGVAAGSGVIMDVEGILFSNISAVNAVTYLFGVGLVSSRAAQTIGYRDSRVNDGVGVHLKGPGFFTSGSDFAADGVATPDGAGRVDLAAASALYLPVHYVLHPGVGGNALTVVNNATGVSTAATFFFRVRPAESSELS